MTANIKRPKVNGLLIKQKMGLYWDVFSMSIFERGRENGRVKGTDLAPTFLEVFTFFFLMYFPAKHWPVVLCLNRLTTAN